MNIRQRLRPNQCTRREQTYAEFAREIRELKKCASRCPKCLIVRERLPQGFECFLDRCPRDFRKLPEAELRSLIQEMTCAAEHRVFA